MNDAVPSKGLAAHPRQGGQIGVNQAKGKPSSALLVALNAGPKTFSEIEDVFRGFGRRVPDDPRSFGRRRSRGKLRVALTRALGDAVAGGWVVADGDRYQLTDEGQLAADRALGDARARRDRVHRVLRPSAAARTTMVAQVVITALKIPAALMSGSLAQLSDAAEEVLDVVASGVVYLGVRANRQRWATSVVVVLMTATGIAALALAVQRVLVPATPTASWYPLSVAAVSIPFYAVRSAYERAAGKRGGSTALISQSVDSRNHAVVALSVLVGLIAVTLNVPLLDTLIGCVVALGIVKAALTLAADVIQAARNGADAQLSRYSAWVTDRFEAFIEGRVESWLLFLVADEGLTDRRELLQRASAAIDTSNPLRQEFGIEPAVRAGAEEALQGLIERGWLAGDEQLHLTDTGRRRARKWRAI